MLGRQDFSTWNSCWEDKIVPHEMPVRKVGLFHLECVWEGRIVPLGMMVGKVGLFNLE